MGRPNKGNLIRFNADQDKTLIDMRNNGHSFVTIGSLLGRERGTCSNRHEKLTGEVAERKAQKAVERALRLNRKEEQLELAVIDKRDPIWLKPMRGREFENWVMGRPQFATSFDKASVRG